MCVSVGVDVNVNVYVNVYGQSGSKFYCPLVPLRGRFPVPLRLSQVCFVASITEAS